MNERPSGDKPRDMHEINREQAHAALEERFALAAEHVFKLQMMPEDMISQDDYDWVREHRDRLLKFPSELLDDDFKAKVESLLKQCEEILATRDSIL